MTRTALALIAFGLALLAPGVAHAAQPVPISYHAWTTAGDFNAGSFAGMSVSSGQLRLGPTGTTNVTYSDAHYGNIAAVAGTWTSPAFATEAPFTELVASWNADTPSGSWLQVRMRGITDKGSQTKWYVMGRWAYGDDTIFRTSVGGQGDADGYVAIDTFFAKDHPLISYQLEVTLYRAAASTAEPKLRRVGAVASDAPNQKPSIPTPLVGTEGKTLPVPWYSQEIHAGQYPEYDGGGEAWCSPTSTSMVLGYWDALPPSSEWSSWVNPSYGDPWVDNTARYVFDYHYDGAGNWPFNTAYAGGRGLDGFVTQLRGLNEAERFINAGIPLVASVAANPNKLTGFLFKGTNGHLLVIAGFTANGDVVVDDPASTSDGTVQRVYDRAEFERAWLPATGGIVYVMKPGNVPLPSSFGGNW